MGDLKLKRCPFCGSKADMIAVPGYFGEKSGWLVQCSAQCVNQMPHTSEQDAAGHWNRRVE